MANHPYANALDAILEIADSQKVRVKKIQLERDEQMIFSSNGESIPYPLVAHVTFEFPTVRRSQSGLEVTIKDTTPRAVG